MYIYIDILKRIKCIKYDKMFHNNNSIPSKKRSLLTTKASFSKTTENSTPSPPTHRYLTFSIRNVQILGGKTVKNVQIDPQTPKIWSKMLKVTLSLSE